MSRDVLVKRVVRDASGKPSYLYGLDGGSQSPSRGSSKREMLGSFVGGGLGALTALTGQHRSLGSLVNSALIGQQQGAGFGRRVGSKLTGAGRKAELQQIQAIKDKNARKEGENRLMNRVERANEVADIRATRGTREGRMADTRGPVRRARDAVAVMRTPAALRDPVNEAIALREQQEQLQALDRGTLQAARQMAESGASQDQIKQILAVNPAAITAALNAVGGVGNPMTQVSGGPAPSGSVPPLQYSAGAQAEAQRTVDPPHADHNTGTNTAAAIGQQLAEEQNEEPREMTMQDILTGMNLTIQQTQEAQQQ